MNLILNANEDLIHELSTSMKLFYSTNLRNSIVTCFYCVYYLLVCVDPGENERRGGGLASGPGKYSGHFNFIINQRP